MCWENCAARRRGSGLIGLTDNVGKSRNETLVLKVHIEIIFNNWRQTQIYCQISVGSDYVKLKQSNIPKALFAFLSHDHNEMIAGAEDLIYLSINAYITVIQELWAISAYGFKNPVEEAAL